MDQSLIFDVNQSYTISQFGDMYGTSYVKMDLQKVDSNLSDSDSEETNKINETNQFNETNQLDEYILCEEINRHTVFPIRHASLWELHKKQEASFWTIGEIDLKHDKAQFDTLTNNEKHFIKYVLAFFASSDIIVSQNLTERFTKEIKLEEARQFYGFQNAMENIHSQMYSLLIETYINDSKEINYLRNAVINIECIKNKTKWAKKWIESKTATIAERLVAFACFEGIFFSGSFCAIFWFASKGKLNGLVKSNEFISRDEGIHTDFACELYNSYIQNKLSVERIHEIIADAVDIEIDFITNALPCGLIGINAELMMQYIKFISNRLLKTLNYAELYPNITNPFDFMDRIILHVKDNFFEKKSTNYSRALVEDEELDHSQL